MKLVNLNNILKNCKFKLKYACLNNLRLSLKSLKEMGS